MEDDAARFALMSWYFEEKLTDFAPYKDNKIDTSFQIIGTSGTVTTLHHPILAYVVMIELKLMA